ncbi:MAG: nucleotidyl transferase AbiEii/AbiGii toxin family protein [Solirubrobacterales bacterium]|nr:nucleotidyl transferase AbiEii/AbiGii toxin family protein [Solirubrobacterales bacterium]
MSKYATPAAFRSALTAKLGNLARDSKWTMPQLRRQFAYDRLLERLYMLDDGWVLKGAVALLARDLGVRGSLDVDVYRAKAADAAEADLREAAGRDIKDWFRFEIGPRRVVSDDSKAVRFPVVAYIGQHEWERFHFDLVGSDLRMTGEPDDVPAIAQVDMPELQQKGYRVYPLVDHVADKVAATFERYGARQQASTRFRDLVDLVAIARGASVDAERATASLRSEFERRGLALPPTFEVPDRTLWKAGYAREAATSLLTDAATLDEALAIVRPFLDPLLQGTTRGLWSPEDAAWTDVSDDEGASSPS